MSFLKSFWLRFWIEIGVGFGVLFGWLAPFGYALPPRITPNVDTEVPGLIRDKTSQLGQLAGPPMVEEVPSFFQESNTSTFATTPCPPTLEEPPSTSDFLREGCEFSMNDSIPKTRNPGLAGQAAPSPKNQKEKPRDLQPLEKSTPAESLP